MATSSVIANTTSNTINAGSAAAAAAVAATAASVVVTSTLSTRKRTYESAIAMPAMDAKELKTTTTAARTTTSPSTATAKGTASSNGSNMVVIDLGEPQAATTLRDSTRTISQSDVDDAGEAASPDDTLPSASTAASSSAADYLNGSAGVKRKYVVPPSRPMTPSELAALSPTTTTRPSFLGSGASDFAVSWIIIPKNTFCPWQGHKRIASSSKA